MDNTISDVARTHLHWALTDGIGSIVFGRLLLKFGSARTALGASAGELQNIHRIGRESADNIARARDAVSIEPEIEAAAERGVRILCRDDKEYPEILTRIDDPPIVLYVKGELRPTDAVAVSIVGSRQCTIYGSEQARRFADLLAGAGFTIVSGLARGIDAFAHHGAVDAGGRSIAVLGNGLREIYPSQNEALASKLVENGALLSELPMSVTVQGGNFPPRNRIIAGLSLGTIVVEARQRSGALITSRLASEYNREVFAVPGRVQDPMSFGTNRLIARGEAKLVTCLEDVLDELGEVGMEMRDGMNARATAASSADGGSDRKRSEPKPAPQLNAVESGVYNTIGYDPILQDAIVGMLNLPPGEIIGAFTSLELKGLIQQLPGQLVVRRGTA